MEKKKNKKRFTLNKRLKLTDFISRAEEEFVLKDDRENIKILLRLKEELAKSPTKHR